VLTELDLAGLDRESGVRRQLEQQCGRRLRFRVQVGGWPIAREFARCGLGAAVVPLSLLRPDDREELVIRSLKREACLRECFIYRAENDRPEQKALRQAFVRVAHEQQKESETPWRGKLFLN